MENNEKYEQLNRDLLESQLRLNISEKDTHLLNDLKLLSSGLHDLSIGIRLINENRSWYKVIPESYIDMRDDMAEMIERIYMKVYSMVKLQLKRPIFKGCAL